MQVVIVAEMGHRILLEQYHPEEYYSAFLALSIADGVFPQTQPTC